MSSTIYTQPNPDGTISAGGWQNGDALAVGRQDHSSVVYNGYLYVLGGFTASNYTNTVWKALIDAGGNPTGWATTTAMPEISGNHASAVFNGDLYVIGGRNDSATINFVQRAHFNPDGTIPAGGWSYTTSLPGTRKFLAGGIHNGYAIVSGGCADVACGTKLADALSAPVNANGEFSEMQALPDLPVGRFWHAMAAWKGCVYVTGGYDGNATSATYFAKALPEGAISGWTPGPSFQNARFGHKSIALNGYLYVIGGFNNVSYLRDVQYAPIYEADCSIGGWSPAQQLPVPLAYHAAAAYNGRIYALGGFGGGFSAKVYYSTANVDGSLSAWNEATDLPTSVSDLEAAAHGGFLYAIGGENGSNPRDDVLYARLNADGSIGAWTQTTKLDKPKYAMASVLYNGFVYLFGGTGSSGPLADVVSAPLNTDGSVGEWNPVGSLASAEQRLAGAAHNGSVYLTGGLANPAKAISARLTTQQASLKSHGSALFDMGVGTDFNTLYVNGRLAGPGSKITVKYRIAPQGGVFGNWGTPTDLTSLQGTVSLGANFGRYIEVAYTIDDNGKDSMSEGKGTSEIFGFLLDFTSLSNGGFCGTDPNVCQSFYCVQGVCCNTGCTTQQQCMEASCATGTCAITDKTPATQCDDSNPCTKSDTCSAKACENNLVPCTQDAECTSSYRCIAVCAGTAYTCMPTECQTDSQCDGAGGCTVANRNAGEPCTDTNVNDCFVSQCDGNGSCDQQRGLQDPTYRCGTSSGELCDLHDFCSGTSGTCVDAVEPGGTKACRTPVNECENDVYCDGTNKFCPVLPSFKPDTERCSDTDNKWCTDDYCDGNGGCSKHVAGNDGCFIGGDCLGEGSRNPANECQVCDSTRNKTSWSNVNQGTPCAVDAFDCTKDVCDGNGACAHPIDQNWCLIDAKCYQGNAENPDNSCQLCDTWKGQDKWTNRTAGSSCDDKDPCTSETKCDATGQCAGGTYDPTLPGCKCDSDADCTIPGATHCDVAGGGQCVECTADGHCGAGDKCNPATHRCETAKCQGDPDCGDAGKPHCRVVTGACVQCYLESHCKPDENCNLSTFTCERAVECSTDAECRLRDPGRPICGPENTCVECIENDHCGADGSGRTICNPETWVCVECMVNPDCEEFHPETPFCRKSDFLCVECIEDRDCGAGKSCDEPAGKCNPDLPDAGTDAGKDAGTKCTSNAQCGGATPVCNVADGKCVECLENSTCVLGHPGQIYCHSTLHKCVECVTSYTCTGGKTCDASTGTCVGKTTDGGTPQTDGGTPNGDGGTPPEDTGGGQPPGGEDAGEPAAEGMKNPYGCMCATLSL
ncbi:MAG: hypothetical protein HY897_00695 [Deltaproteobacteria bacterium]|nr:hypothetical protein [Deltaproteobacteria bacterium]